jgi:glycerol kinase
MNESSLGDLDSNIPVGVHPSSFSTKDLNNYAHYEAAYHDFILDIIKQQYFSTSLILNQEIKTIFVDGGFSNNAIYMSLLAYVFPSLQIFAALLPQSSSRGAAMVIHEAWNTKSLPTSLISLKAYQAIKP